MQISEPREILRKLFDDMMSVSEDRLSIRSEKINKKDLQYVLWTSSRTNSGFSLEFLCPISLKGRSNHNFVPADQTFSAWAEKCRVQFVI